MKNFWKNYRGTLILMTAIIIGAIVGVVFGEKAAVLSPLGDIFLNLMFIIIVPLIFLTITSSIAKMKEPKRLGKIVVTTMIVFVITSLVAVFVGIVSTYSFKLVNVEDGEFIKNELSVDETIKMEELSILERTVDLITVGDFVDLFSRDNLIALLFISIIVGIAINKSGEKGKPLAEFLISANEVLMYVIKIIMYYAPIGIGCYFAALVGTFGGEIAVGYARTFIYYTIISILFYIVVYSIYALIAGGVKALKVFWKHVIGPTATSIATCSSAASIPVNIEAAKKMGVSNDIAETVVPLGTSFHKDGSIIGSVFKIMFLVCLFGTDMATAGIGKIVVVSLIANLLVMAVPIGGGTISEMLILTMMGYPVYALPILTMIATIIDPPATLLNVVGDTASSMLVARTVDGKDWMKKKK